MQTQDQQQGRQPLALNQQEAQGDQGEQGQNRNPAQRGQVRRRLVQPPRPPGAARIVGEGAHRLQHRLVEGLTVGLAHVVGHFDEGERAQGEHQQGGDGGDFGAGHAQRAGQEGGRMGGHETANGQAVRPFPRT